MPGIKSNSTRSVAVLAVEAYKLIQQQPGHFTQKSLAEALEEAQTRVHRVAVDLQEAQMVFTVEGKLTTVKPVEPPRASSGGAVPPGGCSVC